MPNYSRKREKKERRINEREAFRVFASALAGVEVFEAGVSHFATTSDDQLREHAREVIGELLRRSRGAFIEHGADVDVTPWSPEAQCGLSVIYDEASRRGDAVFFPFGPPLADD